jgi:hypothetical protein
MDTPEMYRSIPMLCTFLAPRYRSLPFLNDEQRIVVRDTIKKIFKQKDEHKTDACSVNNENKKDADVKEAKYEPECKSSC